MSGIVLISDGKTGKTAGVDVDNRLRTAAVSQPQAVNSSLIGDTFFIETGMINLTTDGISYLLNFENTGNISWGVESWSATFGETNGVGDTLNHFTFNAENGTLFSAGTDIEALNLNFGSAKQLDTAIKVGQEGSTVTDGVTIAPTLIPAGTNFRLFPASPIIIAPGAAIASAFQPPPGNTSMNVSMQIVVYKVPE